MTGYYEYGPKNKRDYYDILKTGWAKLKEIINVSAITLFVVFALIGIVQIVVEANNKGNDGKYYVSLNNIIQSPHFSDINMSYIDDNNTEAVDYTGELYIENVELIKTRGMSMQPSIFTGNLLITQKYTNTTELREGQIIRFWTDEKHKGSTAHRIRGLYDDAVIVQGDNNNAWERINYTDIESVVIGIIYQ